MREEDPDLSMQIKLLWPGDTKLSCHHDIIRKPQFRPRKNYAHLKKVVVLNGLSLSSVHSTISTVAEAL